VDAAQGADHLRAQVLWEVGPRRPLVDEMIGRDRHKQHVALLARFLEIAGVAQMQKVERAVCKHDPKTFLPALVSLAGQLFQALDLVSGWKRLLRPRAL